MVLFEKGAAAGGGQSISQSEFAGDDGSADQVVLDALHRCAGLPVRAYSPAGAALVAALAGSRVLIPLLAEVDSTYEVPLASGQGGPTADVTVEKDSHVSTVSVRSASGEVGMVVLTGIAQHRQWRPDLAVIPTYARRAAAAAITDGADALVVDPGSDHRLAISGPALWALAEGRDWMPPHEDPAVLDAVRRCVRNAGLRMVPEERAAPRDRTDEESRELAPGLVVDVTLEAGRGSATGSPTGSPAASASTPATTFASTPDTTPATGSATTSAAATAIPDAEVRLTLDAQAEVAELQRFLRLVGEELANDPILKSRISRGLRLGESQT